MRKSLLTLLLIAVVLILLPTSALAHTGLKSSNPADGDVVTTSLSELELTFNTVIEPLSALTVANEAGEKIPVQIETGKESMKAVFEQPLTNGNYTVKWRIIGEDSHNVDGEYAFKVERQAEEQPAAPAEDTTAADAPPGAGGGTEQPAGAATSGTEDGVPTAEQDAVPTSGTNDTAGTNASTPSGTEQPQSPAGNGDDETADAQQLASGAGEAAGVSMSGSTILWVVFGVLLLGGFIFGVVRIASKS
ncbi:copper resistance protein CopC [Paenibacillus aurantiacus]|uniref:Copper resistance protein CopC n=1 Tax=Paenibacillus aurantiacus TaxID=1936118 RepID=A0ABV5KSN8_9BACL